MESIGNITLLQISDLRCIRFLSLELEEGKLTKIAGPNDSGKSTVLDGIKFALEGAATIPKGVIRNGMYTEGKMAGEPIDRSKIRVETDQGYIIERIIRTDKNGEQVAELSVTRKGEGKIASAQTFLNEVSGKYPDPTVIAELPGKDLFKEIVDIADIDLESIDKQIEEIKLDMKEYRRQLKELGAVNPPEGERVEEMSANELLKKVQDMRGKMEKYNRVTSEMETKAARIEQLKEEINNEQKLYKSLSDRAEFLKQEVPTDEELDQKEQELSDIDQRNNRARQWQDYDQRKERQDYINSKMEEGKNYIADLEKKRTEELLNTPLPEGLKLEEETVWNSEGIMWDSLSTSDKLELSTKLAIQSIPEGAPRYIYIQRGESLGQDRRHRIAEIAKEENVAVLMEIMTENPASEDNAIVIEKGEITEAPEEKPAASQSDSYDLF